MILDENGMERYWGVYCPHHNAWLRDTKGSPMFYPAPAIAQAVLNEEKWHMWEVTEFGKEMPVDVNSLPPGSAVCPAMYK